MASNPAPSIGLPASRCLSLSCDNVLRCLADWRGIRDSAVIVFTCTSCSKQLKVKDELAGKKGKCPSCGTQTTVPGDRTGTVLAEKNRPNVPAVNKTMAPRATETGIGNETQAGASPSRSRAAGDNETID